MPEQKGINHNFSAEEVRNIRVLRSQGISLKVISKQYECSIALISKIARRIIYKDVN